MKPEDLCKEGAHCDLYVYEPNLNPDEHKSVEKPSKKVHKSADEELEGIELFFNPEKPLRDPASSGMFELHQPCHGIADV